MAVSINLYLTLVKVVPMLSPGLRKSVLGKHRPDLYIYRQSGALLIELMLVIAIGLAISVWGVNELAGRLKITQANALANWMLMAKNGVAAYLERHHESIAANIDLYGLEGFNQNHKPSWQRLKQDNFLPLAWQESGPMGQKLGFYISKSADCNSSQCLLEVLIYANKAILNSRGQVDQSLLAHWLSAAQGQGLVLWQTGDALFQGSGIQAKVPANKNLAGGTPGLLLVQSLATGINMSGNNGDGTGINLENYLQLADTRNPDFQSNLDAKGVISSGSRLEAGTGILIKGQSLYNSNCSNNGEITLDNSQLGLLVCTSGKWRLPASRSGGAYMENSRNGCKNSRGKSTANPVTGSCVCPMFYSAIQVAESGSITDAQGLSSGYICVLQ